MRCVSAAERNLRMFVLFLAPAPQGGKEKGSDWTSKMQSAQMAIDVEIWIGLSNDARNMNRPLIVRSRKDNL
jgi:hypothetical protein